MKAGLEVKFVTGTKRDPTFGEYLVTPDGQKIRMIFGNNLWRLTMWSDPVRYTNDQESTTKGNTLPLVPTTVFRHIGTKIFDPVSVFLSTHMTT